jgi:superfamily II RNA helicase
MLTSPDEQPAAAEAPPLAPPPGGAGADALLERFLTYVASRGLELYPAQEEALFEILAGKHVVLATPTGSGKSLVATAFLYKALCDGKTGFYSCPVKALVNEKFFDLCAAFGAQNVGLVTGDASVNRQAPILVGTAEILANVALRSARPPADLVVMDEFHYYGDRERGIAWQIPIITLRGATFLLMSATLGDTGSIEKRLHAFTGREVTSVRGAVRPVPLAFEYKETALHETIADLVRQNRAPIYLVNFTQRAAAEEAQNLMSVDICTKAEKEAIKTAIGSFRFDSPYGKELQRFVRHGIGLHHAGLLPRYRRLVERLAQQGLLKVVSGTDTLGVGVNIPIRTVLFTQLCKFDGQKDAILGVREFLQIAGRAGRKGFDEQGWVVAQAPAHVVENKKLAAKAASTGRKVHAQKPPQKGYVHWDKGTFDRLVNGTPEPLESRFTISHGILLALLQGDAGDRRRGGGYRRLLEIIASCHDSDVMKRRHRRAAAACFRTLRKAGLIELVVDERARCPQPVPSPSLQHDFSLHHTLSLYLVDTLALLDPQSESYALDVLSLVEAILENPRPVLLAQLDKLKRETLDALKAQGVEYEQRIEELEKLEWPKPNRDFIYDTFNAFADRHPWVGAENIAPKSVAREMLERFCGFHEYVRDYGLQRSEGVLLRYLSDAYRTLSQSVPARFRTPAVEELALDLGSLVRNVDASLLEEWEALRDGRGAGPEAAPARRRQYDLAADPRALTARVRTELHRLLGALARREWDEALAAISQRPDSDLPTWTAERLASELAPYFAEHGSIVTTPLARSPRNTLIKEAGPRLWDAEQRIIDPQGDEDYAIHARVDLTLPRPSEEAPLIELLRIGR